MDSLVRDRFQMIAAVGCGVVLGVSGIYTYYRSNREMSSQIETLTNSIEGLKREVEELRIVSQRGSPLVLTSPFLNSQSKMFLSHGSLGDHQDGLMDQDQLDLASSVNRSEMTSTTDENEEFYDFTEAEGPLLAETVIPNGSTNQLCPVQVGSVTSLASIDEWLQQVDDLFEDLAADKQVIYDKVKEGKCKFGDKCEIMWRLAKATHILGITAKKKGEKDRHQKLTHETLNYAREALKRGPDNSECHKWYAVAVGSMSDYVSTKEKIQNGNEFKQHVDLALRLKPEDPTLCHMLGRWCFEVSSLTWIERKVASTLFSKVPEASYEDALDSLLKAYEMRKDWKENILFIAKCFIEMKKPKEVISWVDRGLQVESKGEDDHLAHQELLALQTKFAKHRT